MTVKEMGDGARLQVMPRLLFFALPFRCAQNGMSSSLIDGSGGGNSSNEGSNVSPVL